ncbi:N-acetylglucosamine-6-phosphate deacetylase [Gordonia zhaorongruii]|uniref:N-acetylglucosamine-6-phosphate deacetylase n=1 Tax=Gordonia zhaorongruii TaxID=2597659 RepID=UPI001049A5B0|nr:amidohydrolase family protein [Gordonia zhaorongruii]
MKQAASIVAAGALVVGGTVQRPGWFSVRNGLIEDVGSGSPPRSPDLEFPHATVVPGFIDVHVHGGGGSSYTDGDPGAVRAAAAFHREHGTTTTVTSTVSSNADELRGIVERSSELVRHGVSAGIHLEGPWISAARCGAHDPDRLRNPDLGEIDELLAIADGTIAMVTLAPELPGALEAVERFTESGVRVAIGHTDATYERVRAAVDRGARVATHLFNAMAPLGHREPGPILALTEDPRVVIELIGDGVHVHRGLLARVQREVGYDRVALVTDAMAAAGMADGEYRLGSLDVHVRGGVARVRSTDAIAGSTATMDSLFSHAVSGLLASAEPPPYDEALLGAVAMTSTTPAHVLGRTDVGLLAAGRRADFVVLDSELQVQHVSGPGTESGTVGTDGYFSS